MMRIFLRHISEDDPHKEVRLVVTRTLLEVRAKVGVKLLPVEILPSKGANHAFLEIHLLFELTTVVKSIWTSMQEMDVQLSGKCESL